MIIEIKELLMQSITRSEDVEFIDGQPYEHEGYVMTNKYGTYKLIKRQRFSYANFNMKRHKSQLNRWHTDGCKPISPYYTKSSDKNK